MLRGFARLSIALAAALAVGVLVALVTGLAVGEFRGASDNGDGSRLYCGAGLIPATDDGQSAWVEGVVVDYVVGEPCDDPIPSSALLMLNAAVGNAEAGSVFSLTKLGWLYVAAVAVVTGLAAWLATKRSRRRVLYLLPAAIPLVNPDFSRFFVSTYGEPAGLLGTYTLLVGLAAVVATSRTDRFARGMALLMVAVGGWFAIAAKVAYAPVLVAAVGVCLATPVVLSPRWRPWTARIFGLALAIAVVVFGFPSVQSGLAWQERNYPVGNVHNLVFTAVIPEIPEAVEQLGLPAEAAGFSGVPIQIAPPDQPGRAEIEVDPEGFRSEALALVVSHPAVALRGLGLALQATKGSDLAYLSPTAWQSGSGVAVPVPPADTEEARLLAGQQSASAESLAAWLDQMSTPWLPVLIVGLGLAALGPGLHARRRPAGHLALLAGAAAATALGLSAVALADGYFELAKHVWLASYLVDVTAWALVGAVVAWVRSDLGWGSSDPEGQQSPPEEADGRRVPAHRGATR